MKHRHPSKRPIVLNFDTENVPLKSLSILDQTQQNPANKTVRSAPECVVRYLEREPVAAISDETTTAPTLDAALNARETRHFQFDDTTIEQTIASDGLMIPGRGEHISSMHPSTDPMRLSPTSHHRWSARL